MTAELEVRTFVFTDIEASTRRWEHDATAMSAALERHDRILRDAVRAHDGLVLKHTGDGIVAVFLRPSDALRATVAIQRGLTDDDVKVRAGIHTGAAEERDGDWFGPTLNRAARIMGLGRGGHVLVSAATAAALSGLRSEEVSLLDLGKQLLKGLENPEAVYQAVGDGLRSEPALAAIDGAARASRSSLVGRDAELITINRLLDAERCVTLTGIGGCGKTRLATEVARQRASDFADGVAFVELAPVADPAEVPRAVADAVGMPVVASSIARDLSIFLRDRELLLVIDNCEHLLDACADLVELLIDGCPMVTVLATSRESIGIDCERSWRAPSLSLPPDDPSTDPLLCESAELFIARAELVQPGFVGAQHRDAIVAICRGLDGLPLAIELAAARAGHLTPEQIAEMLDDRFRLLTGGTRRARQRQQTLQAAMDWSHDLLSDTERRLLRRLSVFSGGWTLEAATSVCCDGDRLAAVDGLGSLVSKSLVAADETDAAMRYRMLETVRIYAQDRLVEAAEAAELRDRHLRWMLDHVALLRGDHGQLWGLLELEAEIDNLRAACGWSREQDRDDLVVRIVVASWPMWYFSRRGPEALVWLDHHAQTVDESLMIGERVEWRIARGFFLQEAMRGAEIAQCGEEALALDPDGSASDMTGLAWFLRLMFAVYVDPAEALQIARAAHTWFDGHASGDVAVLVRTYAIHALIFNRQWDLALDALRNHLPEVADDFLQQYTMASLATVSLLIGDANSARANAAAMVESLGSDPGRHVDITGYGLLAITESACGNPLASRAALATCARIVRRRYAHIGSAWGIPIVAAGVVLAIEGRDDEALRLLVAVGAHGRIWQARQETVFVLHREFSQTVAERIGEAASTQAWMDGKAMSVEDMIAAVDGLISEP